MRLKKGDTIKIITGKDRNKTGKVMKILSGKHQVLVEGLNLYKKHSRPKKGQEKGQIISVPRPIDVSNAMLICSACGKAVKVGYRLEAGKKTRICKKCGAAI